MRRGVVALWAALILAMAPTLVLAQARCSLSPVFSLFRQVAGENVIGECKEPASFGPNGDVSQATTRGLAVYRYADQVIAFTDGQSTWLFGPEGLQRRAISERFSWEAPAQAAAPSPISRAEVVPPPGPLVSNDEDDDLDNEDVDPESELTPALVVRCTRLGSEIGDPAFARLCEGCGEEYGEIGVACFESAARESERFRGRMPVGSGALVVDAMLSSTEGCIASAERAGR